MGPSATIPVAGIPSAAAGIPPKAAKEWRSPCPAPAPPPASKDGPKPVSQLQLGSNGDGPQKLLLSEDGILAVQSSEITQIWDTSSRRLLGTAQVESDFSVWSRREKALLILDEESSAVGYDGTISRMPTPPRLHLSSFPGRGEIAYLAIGFDSLELLTDDFEIRETLTAPGDLGSVTMAAVAPDGGWVIASYKGGTVVWSTQASATIGRLLGPSGGGQVAAAAGCDCALWTSPADPVTGERALLRSSLRTPEAPRTLATLVGTPLNLQISPDGKLATFSDHRESVVWDLERDQALWRRTAGFATDRVDPLVIKRVRMADRAVFSRDGRRLIGLFTDGIGELDARSGELVGWYGYATRKPRHLLFAADHLFVSDTTLIHDWSLQTGQVVGQARNPVIGGGRSIVRSDGKLWNAFGGVQGCPAGQQGLAVVQLPSPMASVFRPGADGSFMGPWWQNVSPGWQWPPEGDTAVYCLPSATGLAMDLERGRGLTYDPTGGRDATVVDLASGSETPLAGSRGVRMLTTKQLFTARGTYVVLPPPLERRGFDVWSSATGERVAFDLSVAAADSERVPLAGGAALAPDERRMAINRSASVEILDLPGGGDQVVVPIPELVSALDFSVDSRTLFVGTRGGQLLAVRDGAVAVRRETGGGAVAQLVVAPDGRRVATTHEDDGIRLWDAATAELQATLYAFADDEYLVTTPGGAHVGSPEAAARVSWMFSDPAEQFGFAQFASYNDPRIVAARLAGEDVDIEETPGRPPRVEIVNRAELPKEAARATLKIRTRSSGRVDEVRVFVEGRPVATQNVCAAEAEFAVEVPLLPGMNHVEVTAFDARGSASNPATVKLSRSAAATSDLWIVAAGVDDYPRLPGYQLHHAAGDARAVAAAFESAAASSYEKVHRTTLTNGDASVAEIVGALERLAEMREEDVAVVFLSGHGVKRATDGDMVFLTGESSLAADGDWQGSLDWVALASALSRAKGRVLLLLDACHAGHVTQELLAPNNELAAGLFDSGRSGTIVFAASKGRQLSFEPGGTKGVTTVTIPGSQALLGEHALFTAAILATLGDKRLDRNGDGALQLSEFVDDVTVRVSEASQGHQTPWVARREIFGEFQLLGPRAQR